MKQKRLLSLLLAGSMLAATLTGCGNSETQQSSETSKESTAAESTAATGDSDEEASTEEAFDPRSITEGVTLTVAMPENVKISDFETNSTTLAIEEALGVNLEFMTFPAADYQQKINVMVMGGDKLPDIIMNGTSSKSDWSGWIAEEVLLPLDEYYANPDLAANIMAASEQTGIDIASSLTMADGHIYYLPKFGQSVNAEVYSRLWVYEPWLDAIGKDIPTTTEEFYEVCKLISETDLNGNGKKDEIALGGYSTTNWFGCLMSAFVYAHDTEYRIVEDGKVGYAFTTDAWKEGLKYIKRFFDEGLIPLETLTQANDQHEAQLYADEQTIFSFAGYNPQETKGKQWRLEFECLMPLEGPEGEANAMYRPALPKLGAAITVDCENPEAAFLVCDFLCSEEMGITARWGKRGVNWDYWEEADESLMDGAKSEYAASTPGRDIYLIAYDDSAFWGCTDPQNDSWLQQGCYVWSDKVYGGRAKKVTGLTEEEEISLAIGDEMNTAIEMLHDYVPDEVIDNAPLTTEEIESIADAKSTLSSYVTESIGKFLTGAWDIDAEWDAYLKELENIGYKDVLAAYQTGYDRTH